MKLKPFTFGLILMAAMLSMAGGTLFSQTITVTAPTTGNNWCIGNTYNITWNAVGVADPMVRIRLRDAATNSLILQIVEGVPKSPGVYAWTIPASVAPGNYLIRIRSTPDGLTDGPVIGDGNVFTISNCPPPAGSIVVSQPAAGVEWTRGQTYTIQWMQTDLADPMVRIRLRTNPGDALALQIAEGVPKTPGSFSWTIPGSVAPGTYRIRVRSTPDGLTDGPVVADSAVFTIKEGGGSGGPGPDWDRIKDRLRKLVELEWWRVRGPKFPWPNPCLSCPPEFGLDRIRELLQDVMPNERFKLELFGPEGKLSDLGVLGKGVRLGRSFRMARVEKRMSEHLQAGQGFKLVVKNMAGDIIHTQTIGIKEVQGMK